MIDWLINFLGGILKEEYLALEKEYDHQREFVTIYRAREVELIKNLEEVKLERKSLQDLIFKRFGISYSDETECGVLQESLQPVSNGSQRWSNLRSRLEKDDQDRVRGKVTNEKV